MDYAALIFWSTAALMTLLAAGFIVLFRMKGDRMISRLS